MAVSESEAGSEQSATKYPGLLMDCDSDTEDQSLVNDVKIEPPDQGYDDTDIYSKEYPSEDQAYRNYVFNASPFHQRGKLEDEGDYETFQDHKTDAENVHQQDGRESLDKNKFQGSFSPEDMQRWANPDDDMDETVLDLYECLLCRRRFDEAEALQAHLATHSEEKPFECPTCSKCFINEDKLIRHKRTHEGHDCPTCQKSFIDSTRLRSHMKSHEGTKEHECPTCQKRFVHLGNLRAHIKIHTGEKPFECLVCKKTFISSSKLRKHVKTHTGERPYECPTCQKCFTETGHLRNHIKIHEGDKPHQCPICEKSFTLAHNLQSHLTIHTGERPHPCHVCDKSFRSSSNLRKHIKTHTGEKPHECKVCGKRFTESGHLRNHMKTHEGDKPHECPVCKKCFTLSHNLRTHVKIHTGEKPHACTICNKRFYQASNLRAHVKIHYKQEYECPVCNKVFVRVSNFQTHMKTHHPDAEATSSVPDEVDEPEEEEPFLRDEEYVQAPLSPEDLCPKEREEEPVHSESSVSMSNEASLNVSLVSAKLCSPHDEGLPFELGSVSTSNGVSPVLTNDQDPHVKEESQFGNEAGIGEVEEHFEDSNISSEKANEMSEEGRLITPLLPSPLTIQDLADVSCSQNYM